MANTLNAPKTLMEAVTFFADKTNAVEYMARKRWPNGVTCPACASHNVTALKTRQLWQCKGCRKQFSVKVGTIFEDSPLSLGKWLTASWMLMNCRNGVSSCEIARSIGVTQKTAWFMMHRIREAMKNGSFAKLSGIVEADETYIGGSDTNRHSNKKHHVRGGADKMPVAGMVQRGGRVVAQTMFGVDEDSIRRNIQKHVEPKSTVHTDQHKAYNAMGSEYKHETVTHSAGEYVRGDVHTNTIENYWSLVKRMLKGTYIHVEDFHLNRYLDEQGMRYEFRNEKEQNRFAEVIAGTVGRRLTYKELTGKVQAAQ